MATLLNSPAFVAAVAALILAVAAWVKSHTQAAAVEANSLKLDAIHIAVNGNLAAERAQAATISLKLAEAEKRLATLEERQRGAASDQSA